MDDWANCTLTYDNDQVPEDPALFTLRDLQIQIQLVKASTVHAQMFSGGLQAIEVSLLFLISTLLIRVRHKSIKDIFSLRITFSELSLCLLTLIRVCCVALMSGLSAEYVSLAVYNHRGGTLTAIWMCCTSLTFLNICHLVLRTLQSFKKDQQKNTKFSVCTFLFGANLKKSTTTVTPTTADADNNNTGDKNKDLTSRRVQLWN